MQLQSDFDLLASEKSELSTQLQDRMEELAALKTELLKIQAVNQKDRVLIESLRTSAQEQEKALAHMTTNLEEMLQIKQALDVEKEELTK